MTLSRFVLLATLSLTTLLSGCKSTTQEFVDTHYQGYTILRGNLRAVEGLRSSKWEHLTDGIAVEVADPGCQIQIQQGEGEAAVAARSFTLKARDHIIWSNSGDFVLKALDEDRNVPGQPVPVQPAQPAQPAPAQPAPAGQ